MNCILFIASMDGKKCLKFIHLNVQCLRLFRHVRNMQKGMIR